ncbi:uncharacterized protein LOC144149813 [Haemaphysalis longicornis]
MPYSNSFSTGQHCAAYGCTNNQKKRNVLRKQTCGTHGVAQEECGCNMFLLHRFPADPDLRQRWLSAVNRKGFTPTESSRLCSEHFVDGKRSDRNPVPMLRLGYERKVVVGRRRLVKHDYQTATKKRRDENTPEATNSESVLLDSEGSDTEKASTSAPKQMASRCNMGLEALCAAAASLSKFQTPEETAADVPAEAPDGPEPDITHKTAYMLATFDGCSAATSSQCMDAATQTSTKPGTTAGARTNPLPTDATTQTLATPASADKTSPQEQQIPKASTCDTATQWENPCHQDHTYGQSPPLGFQKPSFVEGLSGDDIFFYTGLSEAVFRKLVEAVGALGKKSCKLSRADQLMMCLMRLRLGLLYGHLARIFGLSVSSVGNQVNYMLGILSEVMKYVVVWLPRSHITNSMPASFIENGYDSTTCILDCTEVMLQRAKKLMARAQTYSNYKAHNTVKFLVAIAPSGYIMFVSKAYGGRASDKFITRDSSVGDYLVPGDEIMADRGFILDDELQVQGIKLNTPAFTKGKKQLTEKEVTETRRIASVRIHVERAINRIKTYRIFKQALPIKSKKTISRMIFVCAGLCNLKSELIRE